MMTDSLSPLQSLTYDSLLSVLDQPSVRALEDLIIDAIYAGIISGRMDQVNGRFSVDWVVGRDLDVGGSELRDLGMRLENWYVLGYRSLSAV
jgi:COP9 signalosome complex subunit 7